MTKKQYATIFIIVAILILLLGLSKAMDIFPRSVDEPEPPEELEYVRVLYVIDGDTIDVMKEDGTEIRVRLIGIDAPESANHDESLNTEEGRKSHEFARSALEGKKVGLEYDEVREDKYGRTLAYVWLDGKLFNGLMLEEGYADVLDIPPNEKYRDYLERSKND